MRINRDKFFEDGFLIVRNVIAADKLDELRETYEILLDRQRAVWTRERKPDDPPGGEWETDSNPRLRTIQYFIDEKTATSSVELWLHENIHGVSSQIMGGAETAITEMHLMCSSPTIDYGNTHWHRDIFAESAAPIEGLQKDLLEYGPAYLQWNLPLYDDSCLWVVPGSHRREMTEEESRQFEEDINGQMPGGIQVHLNAGDGAVYTNLILHQGSEYGTKMRRTLHGGFRSIGAPIYPYSHQSSWNLDMRFTQYLSPATRSTFERWAQLLDKERDGIESVFRAIINKDKDTFLKGLAILHPGEKHRLVCLILISKLAYIMHRVYSSEDDSLPPAERSKAIVASQNFNNRRIHVDLTHRFTFPEIETLMQRFAPLEAQLQYHAPTRAKLHVRPMRYREYEMPENYELDDFIKSWATSSQNVKTSPAVAKAMAGKKGQKG